MTEEKLVLIVEDDQHLGEEVAIRFADHGWKAEWFRTPEDFSLRLAYGPKPDVVLTDWDFNMFSPKKGNWVVTVCEENQIPVVLYSAIDRPEDRCPQVRKSDIKHIVATVIEAAND